MPEAVQESNLLFLSRASSRTIMITNLKKMFFQYTGTFHYFVEALCIGLPESQKVNIYVFRVYMTYSRFGMHQRLALMRACACTSTRLRKVPYGCYSHGHKGYRCYTQNTPDLSGDRRKYGGSLYGLNECIVPDKDIRSFL